MAVRWCKDCMRQDPSGVQAKNRPAPNPGPRCATHHREFKRAQKKNNHERMVAKTYGLEAGEYDRIYKSQGGCCAICQRATGKTKRLAVDHDHRTGQVRGLLCSICNQILGHFRDNPEAFRRGMEYLINAQERLREYASLPAPLDSEPPASRFQPPSFAR